VNQTIRLGLVVRGLSGSSHEKSQFWNYYCLLHRLFISFLLAKGNWEAGTEQNGVCASWEPVTSASAGSDGRGKKKEINAAPRFLSSP